MYKNRQIMRVLIFAIWEVHLRLEISHGFDFANLAKMRGNMRKIVRVNIFPIKVLNGEDKGYSNLICYINHVF